MKNGGNLSRKETHIAGRGLGDNLGKFVDRKAQVVFKAAEGMEGPCTPWLEKWCKTGAVYQVPSVLRSFK